MLLNISGIFVLQSELSKMRISQRLILLRFANYLIQCYIEAHESEVFYSVLGFYLCCRQFYKSIGKLHLFFYEMGFRIQLNNRNFTLYTQFEYGESMSPLLVYIILTIFLLDYTCILIFQSNFKFSLQQSLQNKNHPNDLQYHYIYTFQLIQSFNHQINNKQYQAMGFIKFPQTLIIFYCLYSIGFCDFQSGFSQVCYSACPKKTINLQNINRQQIDRQWLQCLKKCHTDKSWHIFILLGIGFLIIFLVCLIIYICYGQKIRMKYLYHVQRKNRKPIENPDEQKIKTFQESFKKFKQIIQQKNKTVCIQFENDNDTKKVFIVEDYLFHKKNNDTLQQLFTIFLVNRQQRIKQKKEIQQINLENNSELQIKTEIIQTYSVLLGGISYTSKGINLWWIKIDDKIDNQNTRCRCLSRRDEKYYSIYQKDPFCTQNAFIGNIVLQDSSKQLQDRYVKYTIKTMELQVKQRNEQVVIAV